jgi:cation diffusion facilitator family transporter
MRALWISFAALGVTTLIQAAVVVLSGSVALLGDTMHNASDALIAIPLAVAFVVGRRPPNRRYTYGYGRAEDLAGIVIVVMIALSSVLLPGRRSAGWHPQMGHGIAVVAGAAIVGFPETVVARYRMRWAARSVRLARPTLSGAGQTGSPRSPSSWARAESRSADLGGSRRRPVDHGGDHRGAQQALWKSTGA